MKIACIVNMVFILMVLLNLVILAKQTEEFEEISKKYRDLNKRNMRMLIKILNNKPLEEAEFILNHELIERESCK